MDNVWGKGGLFEQALASKMALQSAQADSARENAAANTANVANQYDIGLRRNEVDRGQLDVNRGQLDVNRGTLGVNQMNANTSMFRADTERANAASTWGSPMTTNSANNLGLRTFNPVDANKKSAYGFANGGLALKPKMVKQPGYMNGGKVKMPKGYKTGGKIGDVAKDDGTDKVEVVAREGEYFLNPETVAHIGGGDYSKGVRSLDNLVREATGKEPGPVPMGKGGKPGYVDSGSVSPNEEFFRRAALDRMAEAKAAARAPAQGGPTVFVDAQGNASTAAPRSTFAAVGEAPVGESLRKGATQAVNAVKNVLPSVETAAKGVRGFGKVATPVAAVADAADVVDVATDPNMSGRDVAGEVAGKVGKWGAATAAGLKAGALGAAASGPFAPVVAPLAALAGGATGYFLADKAIEAGRALRGVDTRDPSEYSQGVFSGKPAAAAPAQKPAATAPAAAPRDFDKEVRDKLAESEAKQTSLRDMLRQRIADNDSKQEFIGSSRRAAETQDMLKSLAELDKNVEGRAAATASAAAKLREDADKRIDERMQSPKYDKDGKIDGYFKDPTKAATFRDYMAQLRDPETNQLMDFYALPKNAQDAVFEDFDRKYEMQRRLNDRLQSEGVSMTSNKPRVRDTALRTVLGEDGRPTEISFGDIGRPGVGLGDWLTSFGWNQTEKQMVYDPVTKQYVAARHIVGNNRDIQEALMAAGQDARSRGLRNE